METEFDLNRALFLTYVGIGAAFLVLGSLVVFTGLIGWWGSWRLRKAQEREAEVAAEASAAEAQIIQEAQALPADSELAAAVGVAVAMALEAHQREQAAEERRRSETAPAENGGWREQGRLVAFDSRRIRERER